MKYPSSILLVWILLPILSFAQKEEYPIPKKNDTILFYIQRNHNANTIIYDANYDDDGILLEDEPIVVYWRRYEEEGQKMELRTIEKWYAYGVDWKKDELEKMYKIKLVADKGHEFWLKQIAPFKAVILTEINMQSTVLDHIYIFADNSGVWPTVKYIEFFSNDTTASKNKYEKISVK